MFAFLVLCALVVGSIVGCVCISMSLSMQNSTAAYLPQRQYVPLNGKVAVRKIPCKPRNGRFNMGMNECIGRLTGVSLGIVALVVVITVVFLHAVL